MRLLLSLLGLFLTAATGAAADPVLQLPGQKQPLLLRLVVTVDGADPEVAWTKFLDQLFDSWDADKSGTLSRSDVARFFPLPLPDRRSLSLDFVRLDRTGAGQVQRADFRAYCRSGGFAPVVCMVEQPTAEDFRLTNALGGVLARTAGQGPDRVARALRRFDSNDDEYLDRAELLAIPAQPEGTVKPQIVFAASTAPELVLRVDLGTAGTVRLEGEAADKVQVAPPAAPGGGYRLSSADHAWALSVVPVRQLPDVRSAGAFLLAQFRDALGDRPGLTKTDLAADPALTGLLDLIAFADRDRDGRLSLTELEAHLQLVEVGTRSQVWIRVLDHARNPLQALDLDGDSRLSHQELLWAGRQQKHKDLPRQLELVFGSAPARSLGGVPLRFSGRSSKPSPAKESPVPAWFTAMDQNKDGVISVREFLGPPEVFRTLDRDGDGCIDRSEARAAPTDPGK